MFLKSPQRLGSLLTTRPNRPHIFRGPTFPQYLVGHEHKGIATHWKMKVKERYGQGPGPIVALNGPQISTDRALLALAQSQTLGDRSWVPHGGAAAIMAVASLCLQCSVNASCF